MARISGCWALVPALLTVAVLSGCSGVPYAPGPTFEPSPAPTTAPPSAPLGGDRSTKSSDGSDTSTNIDLRGSVVADDGQVAALTASIGLGALGPAGRDAENRSTRRLAVNGTATLTNPTDRINVPAASVDLVVQAGYLRTSPACRALPPPDGLARGTYCWYLLGTTDAVGADGGLTALQPGEQRIRSVTTTATGPGQLLTSDADAEKTNAALHRPAIVVILTAAVDYNGTRLRGGCENLSTVVTPIGPVTQTAEPAQPVTTQNAVVAATSTITSAIHRPVTPGHTPLESPARQWMPTVLRTRVRRYTMRG